MLNAAQGKCSYCGKSLSLEESTLDHKVPLARGGKDEQENLAIACDPCNQIKGHLTDEEFIARGGRRDRTIPYGYKKSRIKSSRDLQRLIRGMPIESRTRDAISRMLRGERVNIDDYPEKISENRGYDTRLRRLRKLAKQLPEIIANEGTIYWLKTPYAPRNESVQSTHARRAEETRPSAA